MQSDQINLLEINRVSKFFPGVKALDGVTFDVRAGEVHALVGGNGAGKSTLMAVASGALKADEGEVTITSTPMSGDPGLARELGLAIVRQEPMLMPDLTVAENLYLGVPPGFRPSTANMNEWALQVLKQWSDDVAIAPADRVISLSPEQRFIVEIVKAITAEPKLLVLDEPTEHLMAEDVERLFQQIRAIAAKGHAVIYISHRIREVQEIADRLTVLRDGQTQGTYDASTMDEQAIVELIVGGELDREFPAKADSLDEQAVVLDVQHVSGTGFDDVSLQLRSGEVLGLAGIDANGQREFMRALAGLGSIRGYVGVNGKEVNVSAPDSAARGGIRFLSGDRHKEGIFAELSVRENFSIRSLLKDLLGAGILNSRSENQRANAAVDEFAVKTPGVETPIGSLSGGNQQKLVLASVLASQPAVLLVDEPTQGVDIGARMEIYKILRQTAAQGVAVIVVSSDAQEVAGLCDRVMIFSRGRVVKELSDQHVSETNITQAVLTSTTVRDHNHAQISALWKWAASDSAPIFMIALAVLLVGGYTSMVNEYYLTAFNMSGVLPMVATLALVAFGQQLLMLIGGIDLSVGPLMGLIVVVESFFLVDGMPPGYQALGWGLIFVVAAAVGALNWLLVVPGKLHPMVATLATYMALMAVSLILRPQPGGLFTDQIMDGLAVSVSFFPVALMVAIAIALALEYWLFRHKWGLGFRGLGSRQEAARVLGINPALTQLAAYVGCSLMTALAAILMMSQVGSGDPTAGVSYTLTSIAAVVIGGASLFGGRGSFIGALVGAVLITQVNVVTTFLGLSDAWQSYLLGGMILISVAFYSKSRQKEAAQ